MTYNQKECDKAHNYDQYELKPLDYQPSDLHNFMPSNFQNMENPQCMMISAEQQGTMPTQKINIAQSNVKVTKRNAKYLAELQGYEYTVEDKLDQRTGKMAPVYICKYEGGCNQEFPRSWNLLDHIRMHYNIRPYQCQYCNFKFTQKGNLNKHMAKHTRSEFNASRKYRCNDCNKVFKKKNSYMVSSHIIYAIYIIKLKLCLTYFINVDRF